MMFTFEKEIMKNEKTAILFAYPFQVKAISEQAVWSFAIHSNKGGQLFRKAEDVMKHLDLAKAPFKGECKFGASYEGMSEEWLIEETRQAAQYKMAESSVLGILHQRSSRFTHHVTLHRGIDFEIEVGERITYEQPEHLSFADIKKL